MRRTARAARGMCYQVAGGRAEAFHKQDDDAFSTSSAPCFAKNRIHNYSRQILRESAPKRYNRAQLAGRWIYEPSHQQRGALAMSYCPRLHLFIAGLGLAVSMTFAGVSPAQAAPPVEEKGEGSGGAVAELSRADELFDQQKWAAARSAYDKFVAEDSDLPAPDAKRAVQRAVLCSLKLTDGRGALRRTTSFWKRRESTEEVSSRHWPPNAHERAAEQAAVTRLEFVRQLLEQIADDRQAADDGNLQRQVADARIAVAFKLIERFDPDSDGNERSWRYSRYDKMEWWWKDVPEAEAYFDRGESSSWWYRNEGIPLEASGKPLFLKPPARYRSQLPRSRKVLFLLDEIETLDATPQKNDAARAMLHRAELARRLYGPSTDPQWWHGEFYYEFAARPAFDTAGDKTGLKELWQLGENEARTIVGQRLRVIGLPAAESPLALWKALVAKYPNSTSAVEAVYQRGLYYQHRRQFEKALGEYRRLLKRYSKHARAENAKRQIKLIEHADVLLGKTGVYAVGSKPKLWFACRNADKIEFTVRRLDIGRYLKENATNGSWSISYPEWGGWSDSDHLSDYIGEVVKQWTKAVPKSRRVVTNSVEAPAMAIGGYVIDARVPGAKKFSRGVVIVSDVAIVQQRLPKKYLLWVVDSRTGKPLSGQKLRIVRKERITELGPVKTKITSKTETTDENGVVTVADAGVASQTALIINDGGGVAFSAMAGYYGSYNQGDLQRTYFAVTDRPLYRPGETVRFKIWTRDQANRRYRRAHAGTKLWVTLTGPDYHDVRQPIELTADQLGSVDGSFQLSSEAALGECSIVVREQPPADNDYPHHVCQFRVEEYKKPEFEVKVTPAQNITRLGQPISVNIQARYYFGTPVQGAQVRYHVRRKAAAARFGVPHKWDWLYGRGFGAYTYFYPWLGDAVGFNETSNSYDWASAYGWGDRGTVVAEGTAELNDNGSANIEIDTAAAPQDHDQQYTIEVQVRDDSRRTIEATGTVLAARQQFAVFAQLDRGWYEAHAQATVEIGARTANDLPVDTTIQLTLRRIVAGDDSKQEILQDAVSTWNVATGPRGTAPLTFQVPTEGQYRLELETEDAWQHPVTAAVNFWVHGPKFDGRGYRFGDLEIIPDRRTYKVGEVARLLVNTAHRDARLLLTDSAGKYRFIDVAGHSRVIEIPLTDRHVPNHFLSATLVRDGELYFEMCQLFIPPVDDILKLELRADKQTYRPGERGRVQIEATDAAGRPVGGELALTAYDKSLTYIQPEYGTGPRSLISLRMTPYWSPDLDTTLGARQFGASGEFVCPEFHFDDGSQPVLGGLGGAPPQGGDPSDTASTGADATPMRARIEPPNNAVAPARPAPAKVRSNFADTAVWLPHVVLDKQGKAEVEIDFPESLTTWRMRAVAVTKRTQVGEAAAEVVTTKNLLVRLQSPRFLVERDEVVLSVDVHNDLPSDKAVTAELVVPSTLFAPLADDDKPPASDDGGELHLRAQAQVAAGAVHRFDWRLKVKAAGLAEITARALTDRESDAMQVAVPVLRHGVVETDARAGFFLAGEVGDKSLDFELPPEIDPAQTRIEVTLSPSAAASAFEAIPFLAGYPYGCVEQTMSRFYPTVLAAHSLEKLGLDIEELAGRLPKRDNEPRDYFARSPVLDSAELAKMSRAGLRRLYRFQHDDGGWGWWQNDDSDPYMTAYVLLGLDTAAGAGIEVREDVFAEGVRFLVESLGEPRKTGIELCGLHRRVFVVYVLSLKRAWAELADDDSWGDNQKKSVRGLLEAAYRERGDLNNYGKALLALAMHNRGRANRAKELLADIVAEIKTSDRTATAHVPTSAAGSWYWYNNRIETNAWVLRALLAIEPNGKLAPALANWLAGNRKHGYYWDSTRDTALAVHALAEFSVTMRQVNTETAITVHFDGRHVRDVRVSWQDLLAGKSRIRLDVADIAPGKHEITLKKQQPGPLFYSANVQFFATPDRIRAAGNGIEIERRYFKRPALSAGAKQQRREVKFGDAIAVGDVIDVELKISAEEDYGYVAFVDPKLAGCEPLQLRSGYTWGDGLCSNVELRDREVEFFVGWLNSGTHVLSYKLRAETVGQFQALPAKGFAMYAPDIQAHSDEFRLRIDD